MYNNPMQILAMLQNNSNPMAMIQQMAGNDPVMQRTMQMAQGKSPEQIQQIIRNIANTNGMSEQQLQQFVSQFGLRL